MSIKNVIQNFLGKKGSCEKCVSNKNSKESDIPKKSIFRRIASTALAFAICFTSLGGDFTSADIKASAANYDVYLDHSGKAGDSWFTYYLSDDTSTSAFCVQRGYYLNLNSNDTFWKESYTNRRDGLYSYYGYPYTSTSDDYFVATQYLYWLNHDCAGDSASYMSAYQKTLASDIKAKADTHISLLSKYGISGNNYQNNIGDYTLQYNESNRRYQATVPIGSIMDLSLFEDALTAKGLNYIPPDENLTDENLIVYTTTEFTDPISVGYKKTFGDMPDTGMYYGWRYRNTANNNQDLAKALCAPALAQVVKFKLGNHVQPEATIKKVFHDETGTDITTEVLGERVNNFKFIIIKDSDSSYAQADGTDAKYTLTKWTDDIDRAKKFAVDATTGKFTLKAKSLTDMPNGTYTVKEIIDPSETEFRNPITTKLVMSNGSGSSSVINNQTTNSNSLAAGVKKKFQMYDPSVYSTNSEIDLITFYKEYSARYGDDLAKQFFSQMKFKVYVLDEDGKQYWLKFNPEPIDATFKDTDSTIIPFKRYRVPSVKLSAEAGMGENQPIYTDSNYVTTLKDEATELDMSLVGEYLVANKSNLNSIKENNPNLYLQVILQDTIYFRTGGTKKHLQRKIYFVETGRPTYFSDYQPSVETQEIRIGKRSGITLLNREGYFKVAIRKLDENKLNEGKEVPVPGATYKLYDYNGLTEHEIATAVTDIDGYAYFDVPLSAFNSYYCKEINSPSGYKLDESEYEVNTLPVQKGWQNYNSSGGRTGGSDVDNILGISMVADVIKNGTPKDSSYATGEGSIREYNDDYYYINFEKIGVGGEPANYVKDTPEYGKIIVHKNQSNIEKGSSTETLPLGNVDIRLSVGPNAILDSVGNVNTYKGKTLNANTVIETLTTDANGLITWDGLPFGTYVVTEVNNNNTAPFVIENGSYTVVLEKDDETVTEIPTQNVYITNYPQEIDLTVIKTDDKGNPLKNVKFQIRAEKQYKFNGKVVHEAGDVVVDNLITDESGTIKNIKVHNAIIEANHLYVDADYLIVETEGLDGYSATDSDLTTSDGHPAWRLKVSYDSTPGLHYVKTDFPITNTPKTTQVQVFKYEPGKPNEALGGAIFELYKATDVNTSTNKPNADAEPIGTAETASTNTTTNAAVFMNAGKPCKLTVGTYYIYEKKEPDPIPTATGEITFTKLNVLIPVEITTDDVENTTTVAKIVSIANDKQTTEYTVPIQIKKVDSKDGKTLPGAIFNLYNEADIDLDNDFDHVRSGATPIGIATTGSNGMATFTKLDGTELKLPAGTYYAVETKEPNPITENGLTVYFKLDETHPPIPIVVNAAAIAEGVAKPEGDVTNDRREVKLEIVKKLDGATTPLPGAKFNLYKTEAEANSCIECLKNKVSTPTPIGIATSDGNGRAVFTTPDNKELKLPVGNTYYAVETKVPDPLKDASGKITAKFALPNEVIIISEAADATSLETLVATSVTKSYSNKPINKARVSVHKTNAEGEDISGAKFVLYDGNDILNDTTVKPDATPIGYATTDNNGNGKFYSDIAETTLLELYGGTYYAKEISAPAPYVCENTLHKIIVTENSNNNTAISNPAEVLETPQKGSLSIYKYDSDTNEPLSGVKFALYDQSDVANGKVNTGATPVGYATTGNDGNGKFYPNADGTGDEYFLTAGRTYYAVETEPYPGYVPLEGIVGSMTIPHDGTTPGKMQVSPVQPIKVGNSRIVKLTIRKVDEYGNSLPNELKAKFRIYAKTEITMQDGTKYRPGEDIFNGYTENGTIEIKGLPNPKGEYSYYYQELEAPTGFVAPMGENGEPKEQELDLRGIGNTVDYVSATLPITNKYQRGHIIVRKIDKSSKPVEGAGFDLYAAEDIYAADGTTLLYAKNARIARSKLTDEDGYAKFYGINDDGTLSDNETLLIAGHKYKIEETTFPEGYKHMEKITTVDLKLDSPFNASLELVEEIPSVENSPIEISFSKKELGSTTELPNALLEIHEQTATGEMGKILKINGVDCSWTSTSEVKTFKPFPAGNYIYHEKTAAPGYTVATDIKFSVAESGDVTVGEQTYSATGSIPVIVMYDDYTKLAVRKVDKKTGNVIEATNEDESASFEIRKKGEDTVYVLNGKELKWNTWDDKDKLDSNGYYYITKIPDGEYILVETKAPKGYKIADPKPFTVTKTTTVQNVEMEDEKEDTSVQISKREINGTTELPGAKLEIHQRNDDGSMVETPYELNGEKLQWISTKNSHPIINLPAGKYVLKETAAPAGHVIISTVNFDIDNDGKVTNVSAQNNAGTIENGVLVMYNDYTKLAVRKVDKKTGNPIIANNEDESASFEIRKKGEDAVYELNGKKLEWNTWSNKAELDSNGYYSITKIPVGEYTLVETKAPKGYKIADPKDFTITETAALKSVEMEDEKEDTSNSFSKRDLGSDTELADAKLAIYHRNEGNTKGEILEIEGVKQEWISSTTPKIIMNIPEGQYLFVETAQPSGYLLSTSIAFDIDADGKITNVNVQKPVGDIVGNTLIMYNDYTKLRIKKVDKDDADQTALAGAEFQIFKYKEGSTTTDKNGKPVNNAEGADLDTWTSTLETTETDKDGYHYITKLGVGQYILHETKAPDGYELAEDKTFEITKNDVKGGINSNNADETKTVIMENKKTTEIQISKRELGKTEELEGAELWVYNASDVNTDGSVKPGAKEIEKWTSGAEAHIIKNLTEGSYVLVEKISPAGYTVQTNISFDIDSNGNVANTNVAENVGRVEGNLIVMYDNITKVKFSKKDAGDKTTEVEGATLKVIDNSDGHVVETWISDGSNHEITKLVVGKTYTFHEEYVPKNSSYVIATDITFKINSNGDVITEGTLVEDNGTPVIVMYDNYTKIRILKFDEIEDGNLISGAVLQIYEYKEGNIVDNDGYGNNVVNAGAKKLEWTTDGKAKDITKVLPVGRYILHEAKAPVIEGVEYLRAGDQDFTLTDEEFQDGDYIEVVKMVDTKAKKPVSISKVDAAGEAPLAGAKLSLYKSDRNGNYNEDTDLIESWTSGIENKEFSNLDEGWYTLVETSAPLGYLISDNITFEVKDGVQTPKQIMKDKANQLRVAKVDKDGNKVEGATLELKYVSGGNSLKNVIFTAPNGTKTTIETNETVISWESGTEDALFQRLPDGTYTITETKAPASYIKNTEAITFTVEKGKIRGSNITAENEDATGDHISDVRAEYSTKVVNTKSSFKFMKVNDKGVAVTGAKLALYKATADGKIDENESDAIRTWISGSEAEVFEGLDFGYYVVKEIESPAGYSRALSVTFNHTADNDGATYYMVDKNGAVMPETGGMGTGLFTILGSIMFMLGLGYRTLRKKKVLAE